MTVVESPKGRASHNLGNCGAIPTFPPPGYCYIFFQNLSRKESSSPPAPSLFRLILRLEKTVRRFKRRVKKPKRKRPLGPEVHFPCRRTRGFRRLETKYLSGLKPGLMSGLYAGLKARTTRSGLR